MSIKKQFLKSKPECKVTFKVDKQVLDQEVESIKIVGNFNNWIEDGEEMSPLKNGGYSKSLNFPTGQTLQFRYLVNDSIWLTDQESDGLVETGLGDQQFNSLIEL